jgi:hypothetical protein
MKKIINNFLIFLVILTLNISCGSSSKLYRLENKNRVSSGKISDSEFADLKRFLASTNSRVKDTILIKYDYNYETCWNRLDEQNDDYIRKIISGRQQTVINHLKLRPEISIFNFREPGNNVNKIKKWDDSIIIDNNKTLFNLLFSQSSTCGNSIMIMPDRQFIFIRSDSHSDILELTQNDINDILNQPKK